MAPQGSQIRELGLEIIKCTIVALSKQQGQNTSTFLYWQPACHQSHEGEMPALGPSTARTVEKACHQAEGRISLANI